MRDRLIELLRRTDEINCPYPERESCSGCIHDIEGDCCNHSLNADFLLENGVIVPPCKLGDTVWYISTENPHVAFEKELKARTVKEPIEGILITKDGFYINTYNIDEVKDRCDKVGEDYAYLSKEDAEQAIEHIRKGGAEK